MRVFCLGPEQIDNLWPEYGHHLMRYQREGWAFAGEIRDSLKAAERQLWGYQSDRITGIAVTQIIETPRGKCCEWYAVISDGGTAEQFAQVKAEIERWAKSVGCRYMRLQGRRGWLKRMKDYRQTGVVMEKEI